ncbi:ABC-type multidrug transport system, ATPase component [Sphaerochaeta pleomorpha str. Grapes]|uniref:ABC-type multidrug transport system, ATPase component n=1 Tax=Sphaerochaeta pleomorpha (strain ATCC BAA-1885 / DSM 22778 / Grapes) TaxID=158190 RepID=G8QUV4_SPHPG|nr:ABC transporter ATP-binding protein [Sphaerochaeta pleomorpha]AEV28130.1 ABC-type multidrug transport system, ATPase component [Sphaerochaeta pleomorpha str. Grapes]
MSDFALEVTNLVKEYGEKRAVKDLSFQVKKGEIFGLLGPNGAGKTTTLECIEGLRKQTSGDISVAGINPQSHSGEFYNTIGVQLQSSGIPEMMTCREAIAFFGRYHGVIPTDKLLIRLGLKEKLNAPYHTLSAGQQRRLSLAIAVVHEPQILFLDEPTAGLDVQSRIALHAMIQEYKGQGRTVILATHDMAEAETLCDTIGIIVQGSLAMVGTPKEVTAAGDKRTTITLSSAKGTLIALAKSEDGSKVIQHAILTGIKDGYCYYTTDNPGPAVLSMLTLLQEAEDELIDLRVERPTLEERFIEITSSKEASV